MASVDLVTPLPRGECVRRLHAAVSSEWTLVSDSPVVGVVGDDRLRIRKRIAYRNSFQTELRCLLIDTPQGGTRIHCPQSGSSLVPVLVAVAAILVLVLGMTVALLASRGIALRDLPPIALIAPPVALLVFAGLGAGVVFLGRRLAQGDADFLLGFLRKTLDAS